MSIHDYTVENEFSIGELNLFSGDNRDEVNRKVVDYLKSLAHQLLNEPNRPKSLSWRRLPPAVPRQGERQRHPLGWSVSTMWDLMARTFW